MVGGGKTLAMGGKSLSESSFQEVSGVEGWKSGICGWVDGTCGVCGAPVFAGACSGENTDRAVGTGGEAATAVAAAGDDTGRRAVAEVAKGEETKCLAPTGEEETSV